MIRNSVAFSADNLKKTIRLNGKAYQLFIGSSGAHVLINGEAFDIIYSYNPTHNRSNARNGRVTSNDARRLPWKALKGASVLKIVTGMAFPTDVLTCKKTLLLSFSKKFRFPSGYLSGEQTTIFIASSDRKKRIRRNLISRMPRDALVTREVDREDDPACYVCLHNTQNAVLKPCGHAEICCACAHAITQSTKKCPICRADVAYFARLV